MAYGTKLLFKTEKNYVFRSNRYITTEASKYEHYDYISQSSRVTLIETRMDRPDRGFTCPLTEKQT